MFSTKTCIVLCLLVCLAVGQVVYTPEVVAGYPSAYYPSAYPYAGYGYGAAYPTAYYGWGSNKNAQASPAPTASLTNNQ